MGRSDLPNMYAAQGRTVVNADIPVKSLLHMLHMYLFTYLWILVDYTWLLVLVMEQ